MQLFISQQFSDHSNKHVRLMTFVNFGVQNRSILLIMLEKYLFKVLNRMLHFRFQD